MRAKQWRTTRKQSLAKRLPSTRNASVTSTTAVAKLFIVTIFLIAASAKHYFNAMRKTVIKVARGGYL
jgi:hypothetical protein